MKMENRLAATLTVINHKAKRIVDTQLPCNLSCNNKQVT